MNSILQQAIDKGIINISDVQEQLYMSKINDIISQHKYKIWQGDNGFLLIFFRFSLYYRINMETFLIAREK